MRIGGLVLSLLPFRKAWAWTARTWLTTGASSQGAAAKPPDEIAIASPLPLVNNGIAEPQPGSAHSWPSIFRLSAIAIALLLLGGVIGLYFQGPVLRAIFTWTPLEVGAGARKPIALPVERIPSAKRVAAMAAGDVLALGRLRPHGGIVAVGLPAGTGDARIETLIVAQSDVVAKGALLAILDTRVQYEAALRSAENTLATRHASLKQTRVQIAVAEAETRALLKSAEVSRATALAELRRAQELHERGAATKTRLEDAQSKADAAQADVARLTATLSRYTPGADGVQVDIALAEAELAAARATVEQARRDLDRARVYAPRAGTVIELSAREGERPSPEGLLRLGDVARMEAELEVFQAMALRIAVGQSVSIGSSILGETALTGKLARIGTLVGRQNVTADDPAANTDARVLEAIVALDAPSSARAARLVGLEVVARIHAAGKDPAKGTAE